MVLYHVCGFLPGGGAGVPFHNAIAHGYRGVNLFYVISGFVLALPYAMHRFSKAAPVNIKAYFLRRLTRLEPPYILSLLACAAVLIVAENRKPLELLPHLGASILYLHNQIYGAQSVINGVAWTLEVEVQFYCLMPVFALLFGIRRKAARRTVLVLLVLFSGVIQVFCWDAPSRAKLSILFAVQFFLMGLLLADLYVVDWREQPSPDWRWDILSAGFWPVVFLMPDRAGWVFFPFLIFLLYVSAFRGVVFHRLFRSPVITSIGGMCYTLYLLHWPLLRIVNTRPMGNRPGAIPLYFLALAGVSCTFFLLVELPCMKKDWPHRLAARARRFLGNHRVTLG